MRLTTKQNWLIAVLLNNSKHYIESSDRHSRIQKILKQKIPKYKWEKLAYTHETNNFAINYSWVYMIGGFQWPSRTPSAKKEIRSPGNLKFTQSLTTDSSPPQEKYLWVGGREYHGNTDYQKVVKVRNCGQKWEIAKITIGFVFIIFIRRLFMTHQKNSPQPKAPIPKQNHNLIKSLLINLLKNGSTPLPSPSPIT